MTRLSSTDRTPAFDLGGCRNTNLEAGERVQVPQPRPVGSPTLSLVSMTLRRHGRAYPGHPDNLKPGQARRGPGGSWERREVAHRCAPEDDAAGGSAGRGGGQ